MPPIDGSSWITIILWIIGGALNILILSVSVYIITSRKVAVLEAKVENLQDEIRALRDQVLRWYRPFDRR